MSKFTLSSLFNLELKTSKICGTANKPIIATNKFTPCSIWTFPNVNL